MIKYSLHQFVQWGVAVIIGFFVVNLICFAYDRQPGWMDTPYGVTDAVREPYGVLIHGTEGYGISRMDKNGFTNPNKELADSYVLMMGASHTQGKEMRDDKKYSVLVSDYLSAGDGFLHTYNIACDGSYLPSQIRHFEAAMKAYQDAEAVTIEIHSTDYSVGELRESMNQVEYNPEDSALAFDKLSRKDRLELLVSDIVPLIAKIKKNIETLKKAKNPSSSYRVETLEYEKVINEALFLIRSETDKPIVFVYHPQLKINNDGSMSIKDSTTFGIFKQACLNNQIDVLDMGDDFINYYNEYKKVPYGFMNTSLGAGHLNEVGHKIIADAIIEYLEGKK